MSRWRPTNACTYVIPDIHGKYDCLRAICKRILPLRDSDKIIFLGDYIDRGPDSAKVVEYVITLVKKFGDRVIPLIGNHEWLMLAAIGEIAHNWEKDLPSPFAVWMQEGGRKTVESYAKTTSIDLSDTLSLPPERVSDLISKHHIDFLKNETYLYYETNDCIFVHGGCDPTQPLDPSWMETFIWDRSLFQMAKSFVSAGKEIPWDKTVICGHSSNGPWVNEKLMMLDCSASKKLMVLELSSMEAFTVSPGNVRLERLDLKEGQNQVKTKIRKSTFRRVQ